MAAFQLGRHFRLSHHRDPAPVGVYHTVQVESSLLHFRGTDELPKEGYLLLPTGSCEQLRKHSNDPLLPRMCQLFSRRCHTNASVGPDGPAGRREHGAGEEYAPGTDAPPHLQSSLDRGNMRIGDGFYPAPALPMPPPAIPSVEQVG